MSRGSHAKLLFVGSTYMYSIKVLGVVLFMTLIFLPLMPATLAHSPLSPGDNESLATATFIPEPTKSWAIYGELHEGGEAQYYMFNITRRERIHVMLFKSTNPEDEEFLPGLILMGLGVGNQGYVPDYVETLSGASTYAVEGEQPDQATYEPFSPSSFYSLADVELDAPSSGTYYIAVHEPSRGGHYGLAVGDRESYSLSEWILIPVNLISVYQWEHQSLAVIFAPLALVLIIGIGVFTLRVRTGKTANTLLNWIGALAGLLFLGTGITTLVQMVISVIQAPPLAAEIVVTLVLALIPVILGIAALRLSSRTEVRVNLRIRIYYVILGVVALFAWAGLLIGPALAIVASLMPSR